MKHRDRPLRFALLAADHVEKNLSLVACALGLASCPLGGSFDDELSALL